MVNHPNRSTQSKQSIEFCEALFSKISGRARVRINDYLAGFDPIKKEVFVQVPGSKKDIWMPAGAFLTYLEEDEVEALLDLPPWDGSNEWELSNALLNASTKAIERYRGLDGSDA